MVSAFRAFANTHRVRSIAAFYGEPLAAWAGGRPPYESGRFIKFWRDAFWENAFVSYAPRNPSMTNPRAITATATTSTLVAGRTIAIIGTTTETLSGRASL